MAIVGTAFVRLRVIGDKLKKDIGQSVQNAVDVNSAPLEEAGKTVGEHVSDGAAKEVNRSLGSQMGRISDSIGDQIGRRMAENMGRSLRKRLAKPFRDGFEKVRPVISRAGDRLGEEFSTFFTKIKKKLGGKGGKGGLGGILMAGMGVLITVLPSILAGAGAIVGAYAATAVTAIAAIGPAAAGAGIAAVAAFSAIKISAGLIGLAMKYPSDALEDFQKRAQTFKGLIATPIQAGLLSGLNASMRLLSPMLTALRPQFAALGTIVGDLAIGFADAIRQGVMFDRIGRILETNNQFVRDAGGGVSQLGQAFIVLLDHLRPVTAEIGGMIGQFGGWALGAINAASASGELDAWINRMWSSFKRLMGIAVDFGIGLYNVFTAAQPAAGNLTTSLENIGRRFREWTGDEANQTRMVLFFEKMRGIVAQVNDILGDLVGGALKGLEGTNVSSLSAGLETLRSLGPPIAQMFRAIQQAAGDKLQEAFLSFADIITELANSGVIGIMASAFANLLAILAQVLALPGVGTILGFLAGFAALSKTLGLLGGVAKLLWRAALKPLIAGITWLASVVGWPITIIVLLVAALVWFFTQTKIGRKIIEAVWNAIKVAIAAAVDWIIGAWDWMVAAFQAAVAWVVDLAQTIWSAISTAFTAVVDTVVSVFTTVRDFIIGVWNAIWGYIQPILQGIWDFIQAVFNGIVTAIQWYLNLLWEIWIRIWPLLALPIRVLYGVIILIFTAVWDFIKWVFQAIWDFAVWAWNGLVAGIQAALTWAQTLISDVWNAIWGFIQPIIQSIVDFVVERWNNLVNNIQMVLEWVRGIISDVWNGIKNFLTPIIEAIVSFFKDRWDTLTHNIQTALEWVRGIISDIWNGITGFIQGAMDTIGGIVSGGWDIVSGAGTAALNAIKAAVNTVIGAINTVIGGINWAIDLANKLPGADIPNIPTIPKLAKGGVVSPRGGGTLAMIAEAGRPERVEPLDPQGLSKRDRAMIEFLSNGAGGGLPPNVRVYLGTREIEDIVAVEVEDQQDRLKDRVLVGTKG